MVILLQESPERAVSQFYSLEDMIQKLKDGTSGDSIVGGLLITL